MFPIESILPFIPLFAVLFWGVGMLIGLLMSVRERQPKQTEQTADETNNS